MSRALRRGGVALAVLVALAGCGSASSKSAPTARIIVQATTAARTTRFTETVSFSVAGSKPVGYEVRGAADFAQRLGEMAARPRPAQPGDRDASSTAEWIGDDVYVTGSAGIVGSAGGWTLIDTAKARASSSPCLAHGDALAAITGGFAPDPTTVLDALRKYRTDLQRVGSDTIRGVATIHWHSAPVDEPVESCPGHRSTSLEEKDREGVDIWIDDHDVARRLEVTSYETTVDTEDGTHTTTSQTTRLTTDFYDLGAPVTVNRPPPRLVHDGTAAFIAMFLGPGTAKSSDWHVAARSATGAPAWTVFAARTTTGWECYDVTPSDSGGIQITSDGPEHNGHPATCALAGGELSLNGPAQVLVNRTDQNLHTIVGAVTGLGSARMELADGTTVPLTVDPNTLLFTWTGSIEPVPIRVHVGTQACRVDGHGTEGTDDQFNGSGNAECLG